MKMTIEEFNQQVREEIKRLNPNLSEEDWNEIEEDLASTDERTLQATTPRECASALLL